MYVYVDIKIEEEVTNKLQKLSYVLYSALIDFGWIEKLSWLKTMIWLVFEQIDKIKR